MGVNQCKCLLPKSWRSETESNQISGLQLGYVPRKVLSLRENIDPIDLPSLNLNVSDFIIEKVHKNIII